MSKFITTIVLCFSYIILLTAQIEVDQTKNVGIGIEPQANNKVYIENTDQTNGLHINSNSTKAGSSGMAINTTGTSGHVYGINSHTSQTTASSKRTYGFYNIMDNLLDHSGNVYGIYTELNSGGQGLKAALYNSIYPTNGSSKTYGLYNLFKNSSSTGDVYGIFNKIPRNATSASNTGIYNVVESESEETTQGIFSRIYQYGSGGARGIDNKIYPVGTGAKTGFINYVTQGTGTVTNVTGLNNNIENLGDGQLIGVNNSIKTNGAGDAYGTRTIVQSNSNLSANIYGTYIDVSDADATGEKWAGYFVGDVYVDGVFDNTSDERLKTSIQLLSPSLARLLKLEAKTYVRKNNAKQRTEYGFLAQDLEVLFPDLVRDVKQARGAVTQQRTDREIDQSSETPDLKAINYDGLIPVLVKAIQEQQTQIDDLKAEIEKLKKG